MINKLKTLNRQRRTALNKLPIGDSKRAETIKILSERATTSQREPTCPTGKYVADLNQASQNVVIQNSTKRIQSLLNWIPALK